MSPDLSTLSDEHLEAALREEVAWAKREQRERQLLFYEPASPQARAVHLDRANFLGVSGGNRSGKTESCLVDLVICATGVIPEALRADFPREKFRGPVNIRVISTSRTTTTHQVMLAKLNYTVWEGTDAAELGRLHCRGCGATTELYRDPKSHVCASCQAQDWVMLRPRGHWGWIPRDCLIDGSWDKSWSEMYQTLKVLYRDPDQPDVVAGVSTWQFMSSNQRDQSFESAQFHHILIDEPTDYDIFRANRSRIMSINGRMLLSMTWPDNPAFPVEWVFDEWYEKAQPGPQRDPQFAWHNLPTTGNQFISQEGVQRIAKTMSRVEKMTRIDGLPIRFSNRIHPLWTDVPQLWCFDCGEAVWTEREGVCGVCQGDNTARFCHVHAFDASPHWPTVVLLDPHPQKPHMLLWVQIDGNDDWWVVEEAEVQDSPVAVAVRCREIEQAFRLTVAQRLMDPNMGRSPAGIQREITWQDEFASVGLYFDLADDSDVGRARINDWLKPDRYTRRPRITVHERCYWTNHQMKRYRWEDRDRQRPKPEHDDRPTMLKYLANSEPSCKLLRMGGRPVQLFGEAVLSGRRGREELDVF